MLKSHNVKWKLYHHVKIASDTRKKQITRKIEMLKHFFFPFFAQFLVAFKLLTSEQQRDYRQSSFSAREDNMSPQWGDHKEHLASVSWAAERCWQRDIWRTGRLLHRSKRRKHDDMLMLIFYWNLKLDHQQCFCNNKLSWFKLTMMNHEHSLNHVWLIHWCITFHTVIG